MIIYKAKQKYVWGKHLFHTYNLAIYSKTIFPVWLIFKLANQNPSFSVKMSDYLSTLKIVTIGVDNA